MVQSSFFSESEDDYDGLKTHLTFFLQSNQYHVYFLLSKQTRFYKNVCKRVTKSFLDAQTRVKKSSRIKYVIKDFSTRLDGCVHIRKINLFIVLTLSSLHMCMCVSFSSVSQEKKFEQNSVWTPLLEKKRYFCVLTHLS